MSLPPIMGENETIIEYTRRLEEYDYELIKEKYNMVLSLFNEILNEERKTLSDIKYVKIDAERVILAINNKINILQNTLKEIIITDELEWFDFLNRLLNMIHFRLIKKEMNGIEHFSIISTKK